MLTVTILAINLDFTVQLKQKVSPRKEELKLNRFPNINYGSLDNLIKWSTIGSVWKQEGLATSALSSTSLRKELIKARRNRNKSFQE